MYCPTCRIDLRPAGQHDPPYAATHRVDTGEHHHPITGRELTLRMGSLKDGQVYRIRSRNLVIGVWRAATQGFIGIREKFGSVYLFEEYHWETGAPFGTAHAVYPIAGITVPAADMEEGSKALFDLLLVHEKPIMERIQRENEAGRIASESKRWAPQTKAEYDKEQRVAAVRQAHKAAQAEADLIEDDEERKARRKEIHQEWVAALTKAIKGE